MKNKKSQNFYVMYSRMSVLSLPVDYNKKNPFNSLLGYVILKSSVDKQALL